MAKTKKKPPRRGGSTVKSRRTASRPTPARRDARVKRPKSKASGKDPRQLRLEREKKLKEAARLKAKKQQDAEREKKLKEAARLKAKKQQDAEREKKLKEAARLKAKKQQDAEREKKLKEAARLKEKKQKDAERERARKEADKLREKEKKERELQKAREAEERAKEKERQRAEKEAQRLAAEAEKARQKEEREAERERQRLEKEAQREEARRQREEERARREAEREAYRKAKEAERERLRAEKEAARRALEGKVARASRRAARAGGRGTTTRVYRPDAIPDQSGTTRRVAEGEPAQAKYPNFRFTDPSSPLGSPAPIRVPPPEELAPKPPPPPTPPPPERIEERYVQILQRLGETEEEFRREYTESFDMSWIYHDSALEGTVYTFQELKTAIDPSITVVPDSSLQPVCEEIRRHKAAIDLVRDLADKKRVPLTVDVIKRIYLVLHPEEGDLKSVKYRKDIPQHRLYFHEYAAPDKIAYKVRQIVDWLNGPEPKKIKSPVRIAARAHYDLLRVFPFPLDSGKVARLLMNVILLRAGYPPAIVHSTERQRYYEALKGALPTIVSMVNESIINALVSIEKRLDDRDLKR
jgi:hypothetical protein